MRLSITSKLKAREFFRDCEAKETLKKGGDRNRKYLFLKNFVPIGNQTFIFE